MPDALPGAISKGFVSPPGIKPGISRSIGECVNPLRYKRFTLKGELSRD